MDLYSGSDRSYSKISETTWTENMKADLVRIYDGAMKDFNSDEPPRYLESGCQVPVKMMLFNRCVRKVRGIP